MFERRNRISIPITIKIISIILILSPVYNLVLKLTAEGWSFKIESILKLQFLFHDYFFLFVPVICGIGLLRVKKWSWYLFLFYSSVLIFFNLFFTIKNYSKLNVYSLLESIITFSAMVYFLQKNISAPYFKLYPRGWRLEKRNPLNVKIKLNDEEFLTRDISDKGFYIDLRNLSLEINEKVEIEIFGTENSKIFKAGLVRIDESGAGFAFRNLTRKERSWLRKLK